MTYIIIDFCQAFRFLTIIPLGHLEWLVKKSKQRSLSAFVWAFPLVGSFLAALGYGTYQGFIQLFPDNIAITLMMVILIVMTGALHEDGLADSADGLGGRSVVERLTIMKDHRIGVYGTLSLMSLLFLRWQLLLALVVRSEQFLFILIAEQSVSRFWMGAALYAGKPAKKSGLAFSVGKPNAQAICYSGVITLLCLLGLNWQTVAVLCITTLMLFFIFLAISKRLFGGITGDLVGALQQLQQLLVLIICLGCTSF